MKIILKIIIAFIIFIIVSVGIMFIGKICPPQGPWIMPPWCENNKANPPLIEKQELFSNINNNEPTNFNINNELTNVKDDKVKVNSVQKEGQVKNNSIDNSEKIVKKGFQKGVTFGAMKWSTAEKKNIKPAINALSEFNVEWIEIIPEWFIFPDITGTEIKPFYSEMGEFPNSTGWITPTLSDSELTEIIRQVKNQGIKIVLKPQVDPINFGLAANASRGSLQPNDWNKWFANYEKFILHYAQLATKEKVDMLVIGTELDTAVREAPNATQKWQKLISQVRKQYVGPLTYSASCYGQCWSPRQVGFWADLDYIGFEPYFGLTDKNNPTVAEMKVAFDNKLNKFAKPLFDKYHKPIIITEANVYSYDGVNKHPINPPTENARPDQQEQADYYEALFQSLQNKTWINGIYWWGWYLGTTIPNAIYTNDLYDPFVRKPAGQVMKKWYKIIVVD